MKNLSEQTIKDFQEFGAKVAVIAFVIVGGTFALSVVTLMIYGVCKVIF